MYALTVHSPIQASIHRCIHPIIHVSSSISRAETDYPIVTWCSEYRDTRFWILRYEILNTEIWDSEYRDMRYRILRYEIPNTEIWDSEYWDMRFWILRYEIQNTEIWDSECRDKHFGVFHHHHFPVSASVGSQHNKNTLSSAWASHKATKQMSVWKHHPPSNKNGQKRHVTLILTTHDGTPPQNNGIALPVKVTPVPQFHSQFI